MRSYRIKNGHKIEREVTEIIKNAFGEPEEINSSHFVVDCPRFDVIERVEVIMKQEKIKMDIKEVSVDEAFDKEILDEVPQAVKAKNELLEQLTGRTVSDRKQDMRKKAIEDIDKATHPSSEI